MCLIIDNDVAQRVLSVDDDPDLKFLHCCLFSKNSNEHKVPKNLHVCLVYGGQLLEEYQRNHKVWRLLLQLDRAGKAKLVSNEKIDDELSTVRSLGVCRSNDVHIIALARAANVRLLCSNDNTLWDDFRDKRLIDKPRGKIYLRDSEHRDLLVKCCRK